MIIFYKKQFRKVINQIKDIKFSKENMKLMESDEPK